MVSPFQCPQCPYVPTHARIPSRFNPYRRCSKLATMKQRGRHTECVSSLDICRYIHHATCEVSGESLDSRNLSLVTCLEYLTVLPSHILSGEYALQARNNCSCLNASSVFRAKTCSHTYAPVRMPRYENVPIRCFSVYANREALGLFVCGRYYKRFW